MKRRILKAFPRFVSLVPRGANKLPVLYKTEDETVSFNTLVKAGADFDEKGEITAVVYAPEVRDAHGDIASADVIAEMSQWFMKSGAKLDVRHEGKALTPEQAFVSENFIIQKGDERFANWKDTDGNPVDVTGGWAQVIKIDDPALRKSYRDGEWQGVSLEGPGVVQVEKTMAEITADDLSEDLRKQLGITTQPDETMSLEDLQKALAEAMATQKAETENLVKSILKDAGLIKEDGTPKGDEDKFDPADPASLQKHLRKEQLAAIQKQLREEWESVDVTDTEEVAAFQKHSEELLAPFQPKKASFRKAAPSNAGDHERGVEADLVKEDSEAMAKEINSILGVTDTK